MACHLDVAHQPGVKTFFFVIDAWDKKARGLVAFSAKSDDCEQGLGALYSGSVFFTIMKRLTRIENRI